MSKKINNNSQIISTVDDNGEILNQFYISEINKNNKTNYNKNEWCRLNQKWSGEKMNLNGLYTLKGQVFNYLISIMEYGNFSFYNGASIGRALGTSRQAVSKAKKELMEDGLLFDAYNKRTGAKGVYINNNVVEKGEKDDDIIILYPKNTRVPEDEKSIKLNIIDLECQIKKDELSNNIKDLEEHKTLLNKHISKLEELKKGGEKSE